MVQKNKYTIAVAPETYVMLAVVVMLFPVSWVIAWLVAVTVHELGHWGMVTLLGRSIYEIIINPNGVQMRTEPLQPAVQAICSLSGPLLGLSLIFVRSIFPQVAVCALLQCAYNLLPIANLDGAVALQAILVMIFGQSVSKYVCTIIENIIWLVFFFIAVYCLAIGVGWLPLFVFAALLLRSRRIKIPCKRSIHAVQ